MLKISRKDLANIYIYIIVLSDFGFFYIFKLPDVLYSVNSTTSKTLIGMLVLIYFGGTLLVNHTFRIRKENINVHIILMLLAVADVITLIRYNFPVKMVLLWIIQKSIIYFAIPLFQKFLNDGGIEKFLNICTIFSFIWIGIGITENIIYKMNGRHILYMYLSDYFMRNNYVRVLLTCICHISIFYVFALIIVRKTNWRHYLFEVIAIGYIFLIDGTRAVQLGLTSILVVTYILVPNKSKMLTKIIVSFGILVIGYFFIQSSVFSDFLASFITTSNNASALSAKIRFGEWQYFIERIIENPILGVGDILSGFGYDYILNGGHNNYYTEDIGIIGSMARFGVIALIIYLIVLSREIKVLLRMNKQTFEYAFCLSICFYTVFSMISLSFLDIQRILYFAIFLAIFNFYFHTLIYRNGES